MEALANAVLSPTTTLNGAINNSTLTIVVNSAAELPATGAFRILIWDGLTDASKEIVKILSRAGTTLTAASRATEGPNAAQSHANADRVDMVLTANQIGVYVRERAGAFNFLIAR